VIRRHGKDILWHKERLLNLALSELPDECEFVAWLDTDVVFEDDDWAARTAQALGEHRLVQPFQRFLRLGPGECVPGAVNGRPVDGWSLVHLMNSNQLPEEHWSTGGTSAVHSYTPGLAWAARREDLLAVGLYDGSQCDQQRQHTRAYRRHRQRLRHHQHRG
jgi:hypothetical protein